MKLISIKNKPHKVLPPLLITSGIRVGNTPFMNMTNEAERLDAIIKGVKEWQSQFPNLKIVIVDGTGFELNAHINDPNIETLTYRNDQRLVEKLGKGAGEAQDIQFALQHSSFILDSNYFMKITGKRWLINLHRFKSKDLFADFKCKPIVSNGLKLLYINTAFFSSNRFFYLKYFNDIHFEVNDFKGIDLEKAMAKRILLHRIRSYVYKTIPELRGWDGTGNHSVYIYPDKFKHVFRNIKYRILSAIL